MINNVKSQFEDVISKLDDNTQSILRSIYSDNQEDALKLAKRAVNINRKINNIKLLDTIRITNN